MTDLTQGNGTIISQATVDDVFHIKFMVDAAFSKYIDRIGKPPAPMTADYSHIVSTQNAFVLLDCNVVDRSKRIIGFIALSQQSECDLKANADSVNIDILVVDASAQGRGYGRALLNHAENEARRNGIWAVRMGFVEVGRRTEKGFDRVFFRKDLPIENNCAAT
ncbi:conserved hypothetical protein [Talaromyces stipitatus ATCC 10500]|uniref:N-acetyltransferase domain-containing protein n=1 Tax=Talaromyces stipitatus (strain ATCC 10500 / CBS 375.48 / QM 6759 / NRRL 1006) TaxID=441959 RepID=B8LY62_TALSN|nr:uncharacterized protein TSTA_067440 [Talaromyces stipitatus ATCC 10500]EED23307.1 conserved hypothetical protein [Talaromyces stipitatus ATCC 10500]